ncbi:hypothetical protein NDU88_002698 [Pleurodeles waltl]|uniref:Uncharacterized protein n=1 Tax=Pleurodeles waltl TaxID=8319 RepID=A0AAV7W0F3_PLEWA|nr:hypothetical protein NDU88_002698 [Pleurodeles waltl]
MRAWASMEEGERGAGGEGETSGVDRGIEQRQENNREPSGLEEQSDSGLEESKVVPAALKEPCKLYSHASGEAWPFQVRPLCRVGKGKGGWEEVAGQNKRKE